MAKSLRLSEKWFRRGLWLLSYIFAGFLVGLGGLIINDLPKVEENLTRELFVDHAKSKSLSDRIYQINAQMEAIDAKQETLNLELKSAKTEYAQQFDTFRNWLATRSSTQQSSQNLEVIERTKKLDLLKGREAEFQNQITTLDREKLSLSQERGNVEAEQRQLNDAADEKLSVGMRKQELRVFLYRLTVTMPLMVIAGWLFVKKRKGAYWPFVWGFIFFALFTFFVELVPYLPSYGGYVRYIVGIIITMIVGHYGIKAMQNYLEQQKAQEAEPDSQRRQSLVYDTVLTRLSKKVCPGCERPIDVEKPEANHCPHCGISVFNKCPHCQARKNSFSPFCYGCGAAVRVE